MALRRLRPSGNRGNIVHYMLTEIATRYARLASALFKEVRIW